MTSKDEKEFFSDRITITEQDSARSTLSPTTTAFADLDIWKGPAGILPRLPVSEAHSDFYGLPSNPTSIYHTGAPWPVPLAHWRIPKETRPICNHPIAPMWPKLGERIYKYFDSVGLKWTSIDPIRFAEVQVGKEPGPLFLWVGVMPKTLSCDDAKDAAVRCKAILTEYDIKDVEIAFRESVVTRSAGPQLLDYVPSVDPTADVCSPFTPALGLPIAPKVFPYFEGSGCLYLCEGGEPDRVLLLTARHVVLPPSEYSNSLYHRKDNNIPRRDVIHFGSEAYQNVLTSITGKIMHETLMADHYKDEIEYLGEVVEGEDTKIADTRKVLEVKLAGAKKSRASVNEFHGRITRFWTAESQRILGHVLYAPPISIGTGDKQFTEDWALVELNNEKFNWDTFQGNVINLGMFRSISLGSSSLTLISRNQNYTRRIHDEDVP